MGEGMRLALLSLAHISLCRYGNPFGWSPWVLDEDQTADKLARCVALHKAGKIGGVYLVCGCGALPSLIECGYYPSGDPVRTCWAGHSDQMMHEVVYRFAEAMPVTVSVGLPTDFKGLNALRDECLKIRGADNEQAKSITLVFDASGANADERVEAVCSTCDRSTAFYRLESRPIGTPVWTGVDYATMSARLQTLVRRGQGFNGDIAVFNNGLDSPNLWNTALAAMYESRGATVAQPLETMPQEGDAGGEV